MGYYTNYSLDIDKSATEFTPVTGVDENGNPATVYVKRTIDLDQMQRELANDCGYERGTLFGDGVKWYEHEKDMREFSKKYPDVLFILSGEGEDNEDIWRAYFKNGKMQKCKAIVSFDPFDEEKLI